MPTHLVRFLCLLTLAVTGALTSASTASARYIEIPGTFATETKIYGPESKSCVTVTFIRWSGYEYATGGDAYYTVTTQSGETRQETSEYARYPEYADHYDHGGAIFNVPAGSHQVVAGKTWAIGDPTACSRFSSGGISNPVVRLWVDDYPRASFTAKELSNEQGAFDFTSTSYSPVNRALLEEWDFGDDTTASQRTIIHRYKKPGYYNVKLKVTDTAEDLVATAQQTVHAAAPTLSTSIIWDEDVEVNGRIPLNEPIDITVRIRASDGIGDLSELTFGNDQVLAITDGHSLAELEVDDAPGPFTLAPGEYRDFKATLTPHDRGELQLSTSIEGEDAAGNGVSEYDDKYTRIGQDLEVTVTPDPEELDLEFDQQSGKPISKPVAVGIDVKNVSGSVVEDAKLDVTAIVRTQISRDPSAPKPLVFIYFKDKNGDQTQIGGASAGGQIVRDLEIGDLAEDETVHVAVLGQAQEKARVRVTGIVRGVIHDDDGAREAAGSDRHDVRIGQPTLLRVIADDTATTDAKVGALWSLHGTIENVSPSENVTVRVLTQKLGNTIGQPVDDSLSPTKNPLGTVVTLKPHDRLLLSGKFSSDPEGSTRSTVDLMVDGWVKDEDTGEDRELLVDEIAIQDQPNGDPATRRVVHLDTKNPEVAAWTAPNLSWYFTDGFARGFGRWVDSTLESLQSAGMAVKYAATWGFYLPATIVKYMSPLEREQAFKEISDDLAGAYAALKKISYAQARAAVDQAVQAKLGPMLEGYETGDSEKFAGEAGKLLGEAAPDLIIDAATSVIGAQRLVSKAGFTVLSKADEAQEASKAARVASKGIKGFEAGDAVDFAHATKYWGIDSVLDKKLRNYLKDKDFVISMRERSPGSIKRLAEGALGKIEMIKSKNVSDLDVKYLGFADEHLDLAMYKEMDKWANVQANVLSQNPGLNFFERRELLTKVKSRWKQRADEFVKESEKMAKYVDTDLGEGFGHIPVPNKKWGLNPNGNIDPNIEYGDVWDKREFKLAEAGKSADVPATKDGLRAFQPQIMGETASGKGFKPLTGDMDLIAIVDKNGKVLSEDDRLQIYRDLAEMGFQHPESLTWNDKAGRAKYLKDFDIASGSKGQALLAYMPGGETKAVMLDTRKWLTELDPTKGFRGFALLQGMRLAWGDPVKALAQTTTPDDLPDAGSAPPEEDGPQPYLGPPTGDEGADYDAGDDSPLTRLNLDGSTSSWDKDTGRWVKVPTQSTGSPKTTPQTGLTSPTDPGASKLDVIGQDKLAAAKGKRLGRVLGKNDWFKPGDVIVVNPGGTTQELATLASIEPITTTTPLKFQHWPGQTVALVPKVRPPGVDVPVDPGTPGVEVPQSEKPAGPVVPRPTGPTLTRPSAAKAPKITGTARVGKSVTCVNSTWQGSAPLKYAYAWQTKSGKRWKSVRGKTKPKLKLPSSTARRQLRCTVTATNPAGTFARSSAARTVAAVKKK